MAVKKVNKTTDVEVKEEAVVVDESVSMEEMGDTVEVEVDETVTVDEEPQREVSVVETETTSSKKDKSCRIKMRCDHSCFIGGEWYYLKEGSCYNVDENVKRILGNAGLLAPL